MILNLSNFITAVCLRAVAGSDNRHANRSTKRYLKWEEFSNNCQLKKPQFGKMSGTKWTRYIKKYFLSDNAFIFRKFAHLNQICVLNIKGKFLTQNTLIFSQLE